MVDDEIPLDISDNSVHKLGGWPLLSNGWTLVLILGNQE